MDGYLLWNGMRVKWGTSRAEANYYIENCALDLFQFQFTNLFALFYYLDKKNASVFWTI